MQDSVIQTFIEPQFRFKIETCLTKVAMRLTENLSRNNLSLKVPLNDYQSH